jgi:SAM-dependent methyltransferase
MRFLYDISHRFYRIVKKSYGALYAERTGFVLNHIKAEENILILGARESFVRRIVEHTHNALQYHLVDKHPSDLEKKNFIYKFSDLNESIPFPDKYFDCIVSDQLIEHLYQPDSFVTEMKRVVKIGGTIIIGSENLAAWHNIFALVLGFHPFSDHYSTRIRIGNPLSVHYKEELSDPLMRHSKVPTMRALVDLLEYYGFAMVKCEGFGHLLPLGPRFDKYHSIQFVVVFTIKN